MVDRTPFDPPDPTANFGAEGGPDLPDPVSERRRRARRVYIASDLDPSERVAGGFGAMNVIDRTSHPGAFLDPHTAEQYLGEGIPSEGSYSFSHVPWPSVRDLYNPLSVGLGVEPLDRAMMAGTSRTVQGLGDLVQRKLEEGRTRKVRRTEVK